MVDREQIGSSFDREEISLSNLASDVRCTCGK